MHVLLRLISVRKHRDIKNSKTVLLCRHMHALQLQQNSKASSLADRIKQLSDSQRSYRVELAS